MSEAGRLRILYVDDDKDIRHIVKLSLTLDPLVEVRLAADPTRVLEELTGEWHPDVVMLDVMMPKIDGLTLMSALRQRPDFQFTPFIFVTARAREADVQRYHTAGAAGVILKPFDPLTLVSRVRALIE